MGRSFDGPRSPTEEEPGKGRAQQGTTSGTTGKKPTFAGLTTFKIVGKLFKKDTLFPFSKTGKVGKYLILQTQIY